jgi:nitric oxide reductase activation protein
MIALTHVEYEEVRAHGTHFAIALDHESPELDLMVSEQQGFAIVRKLPGLPARLANESDPRRARFV